MARVQQQYGAIDAIIAGLCLIGVLGTFIAVDGLLVTSAENTVFAGIVAVACRAGFCGSVEAIFRLSITVLMRIFSASLAFAFSLSTISLIAKYAGWPTATIFMATDALIFGTMAAKYLPHRQEPESLFPYGDRIGIFEVLREFCRDEGALTIAYLPQPPHSADMDRAARALLKMVDRKGKVTGPYIVESDRIEMSVNNTHRHLFEHDPRYFEVYHIKKCAITRLIDRN